MPLKDALSVSSLGRGAIHVRKEVWPQLRQSLQSNVDAQQDWDRYIVTEQDQHLVFWGRDLLSYRIPDPTPDLAEPGPFLLHLFAPDPLRKLVEDVAGTLPPPQLT
jgi:hypothetical protein